MLIIFFIGFLLLTGLALMVLDAAIQNAGEGYEDEKGFHQKSRRWTTGTVSPEAEINCWDQADGASCPLDLSRPLHRTGTPPFVTHQ